MLNNAWLILLAKHLKDSRDMNFARCKGLNSYRLKRTAIAELDVPKSTPAMFA